jgi:cobalt-zinc-cadmium resistance protein CzcA
VLLALTGAASFQRMSFDAFPDTTPVQVAINAVAPALSPLEIESQVAFPIEQAVSGLPGMIDVRSLSRFGFTQVVCVFEDGTDLYRARQVVGERLHSVELPAGVPPPALGPITTGLGEVFQYLVRADNLPPGALRTLHDWEIRPRLRSVPGVAEVNTWGGHEERYEVVVDPARLLPHDLILDDIVAALERNNLAVGGGWIGLGGEAQIVQGTALARSVDDLAAVTVAARDGVPVLLGDVAEVKRGHQVRLGAVTAEGRGEVVLGLGFMLLGENSREVTEALADRLEEVAGSLPAGVTVEPVYVRTHLVDQVLSTVRKNLVEGALLVVLILFAFLADLRAGLIVALAIPLSLLFAFNAMLGAGIAGSLMSLGALDFGLVVDSSVIQVENCVRRLRLDSSTRSVTEVVRDAALEVRRPTLFGELIIAVVYLPVLTLEGIEGKMFRPMALTVLFALAGSMVLSLTLTPALCSLMLKRDAKPPKELVTKAALALYRPVLDWALRHRRLVLAGSLVLLIMAGVAATQLGTEFVPRLREQALVVNTVRLAGVSLDESVRYGSRIEELLLQEFPDEIEHVWSRTGTAEVATDPMGMEVSDVFLTLSPAETWTRASHQDELAVQLAAELEGLPGMRSIITQPIEMRMNEITAGIRADLGLKIFGDDLEELRLQAEQVARLVRTVPGAADVTVEQLTGQPVLQVSVKREALARHGIDAKEVLEVVEAMGGLTVGEVREGLRHFDLAVRLTPDYRRDPNALGTVQLAAADGRRVSLAELATIERFEGPASITREWTQRRVLVQANVRGRDVGSFVNDVRDRIAELELPTGYFVRFGGQFEHMERARARLAIVVPLALILILLLLYVTYGNLLDAGLVFTSVPFAAVGGIAALLLRGLPFSISAGVGFVAVSGVAVLGEMVLVSHLRQLIAGGMDPLAAIGEAARSRLRPVLMTGLVAALGFVPMALNTGVGAEVQRPLATVVVGGVLTSTLTTLVLFPVLYAGVVLRRRSAADA